MVSAAHVILDLAWLLNLISNATYCGPISEFPIFPSPSLQRFSDVHHTTGFSGPIEFIFSVLSPLRTFHRACMRIRQYQPANTTPVTTHIFLRAPSAPLCFPITLFSAQHASACLHSLSNPSPRHLHHSLPPRLHSAVVFVRQVGARVHDRIRGKVPDLSNGEGGNRRSLLPEKLSKNL